MKASLFIKIQNSSKIQNMASPKTQYKKKL